MFVEKIDKPMSKKSSSKKVNSRKVSSKSTGVGNRNTAFSSSKSLGDELRDRLLKKSGLASSKNGRPLKGNVYRYHTIADFQLEIVELKTIGEEHIEIERVLKGTAWSDFEYWRKKGDGDHAEDKICDLVEMLVEGDRNIKAKSLKINISSSPCNRCRQRLNNLVEHYCPKVTVTCARKYKGAKGSDSKIDVPTEVKFHEITLGGQDPSPDFV